MQTFIDQNTPRYQLPFDKLPRGFVPYAERAYDAVRLTEQKTGHAFTSEELHKQLEIETLAYFYEGLPVAYRSRVDGIDVLAVGPEEMAPYWCNTDNTIKVVQP